MTENNDYTAKNLSILKELEPVRTRPGMYIGTTDTNGTHHLVWELLDNAIDEANAGYGKHIYLTIQSDGSLTVQDEGRGVPCDFNEKEKLHGVDMVYKILHSGGKFDDSNYKVSSGLHGVGSAVVNALSERLEVTVYRDGNEYNIVYQNGGKKQTDLKIVGSSSKRGTKVTFKPDKLIFSDVNFDYKKIASHMDDSACLCSGIHFYLKDERTSRQQEFYYKDGLVEYLKKRNEGRTPLSEIMSFTGTHEEIEVEVVAQYFDEYYDEQIYSFANSLRTLEGGTHVVGLKKAFTKCINDFASNHKFLKNGQKLEGEDIREGLCAVISVRIIERLLQFEGQVKGKLGSPVATSAVDNVISNTLSYYLEEHIADAEKIVKKTVEAMNIRKKAKDVKEAERGKRSDKSLTNNLSGKLTPTQSKEYNKCELFIVEGDSAGGSAKKCRDRKYQAILPLRGKPKNATNIVSLDQILENKELYTLIATIGAGCDDDFLLKNIHYDKIIIMTDADDDGAHIQNLLLSFFYTHMRELVTSGHVYLADPPLYRIHKKDKQIYCWSNEELDKARLAFGSNYLISRYKGLGEMDAGQLWDTTMNPHSRTLIQVHVDDEDDATDKIELFLGKFADRRKDWIENNIDFGYEEDHLMEVKQGEK